MTEYLTVSNELRKLISQLIVFIVVSDRETGVSEQPQGKGVDLTGFGKALCQLKALVERLIGEVRERHGAGAAYHVEYLRHELAALAETP